MAKPAQMTAFLGRCRRLGLWQVPAKSTVFALFGTCHLDMRKAYADKEVEIVKMKVTSIFGGVEIIVPDGVEVRPSGTAFLAVSDFDVPKVRSDASLPPIELDSLTIFGRLRLHTAIDAAEAEARDAEAARIARLVLEDDARKARQETVGRVDREAAKSGAASPADVATAEPPAAKPQAAAEPELSAAEKKANVIAAIAAKKAAKKAAAAAEAGETAEPEPEAAAEPEAEPDAAAIAAAKKAKVIAAIAAKKAAKKKAAEDDAAAEAASETASETSGDADSEGEPHQRRSQDDEVDAAKLEEASA